MISCLRGEYQATLAILFLTYGKGTPTGTFSYFYYFFHKTY